MVVSIELQGFKEMDARLTRGQRDLPARALRAMQLGVNDISRQTKANIRGVGAVDQRKLLNSVHTKVEQSGAAITGTVSVDSDYAAAVENGRRAGAKPPPSGALLGWVRRHQAGVGATFNPKTRRRRGTTRQKQQQDRRAAFLIARAIGRRGIKARPFFRPAVEAMTPRIQARFRKLNIDLVATFAGKA